MHHLAILNLERECSRFFAPGAEFQTNYLAPPISRLHRATMSDRDILFVIHNLTGTVTVICTHCGVRFMEMAVRRKNDSNSCIVPVDIGAIQRDDPIGSSFARDTAV